MGYVKNIGSIGENMDMGSTANKGNIGILEDVVVVAGSILFFTGGLGKGGYRHTHIYIYI